MSADVAPRREPPAAPSGPRVKWPWLGLLVGVVLLVLALVLPGKTTAVATVDGTSISYASFRHWMIAAATSVHSSEAEAPAQPPDPPNYTRCIASEKAAAAKQGSTTPTEATLKQACQAYNAELGELVMGSLVSGQWFIKEGQRENVKATSAQIKAAMKSSFPGGSGLGSFLNKSHLSRADLMQEAEIYVVSAALRARHAGATPTITSAQIAAYYEKYHSALGSTTLAQATPEIRQLLVAQEQAPAVNAYLKTVQARYRPLTSCARGYRLSTYCRAT